MQQKLVVLDKFRDDKSMTIHFDSLHDFVEFCFYFCLLISSSIYIYLKLKIRTQKCISFKLNVVWNLFFRQHQLPFMFFVLFCCCCSSWIINTYVDLLTVSFIINHTYNNALQHRSTLKWLFKMRENCIWKNGNIKQNENYSTVSNLLFRWFHLFENEPNKKKIE